MPGSGFAFRFAQTPSIQPTMLRYEIIPVTAFAQNCSVLWCDVTGKGVVVDPGGDVERILAKVDELGVSIERILLTHGHVDHVGGAAEIAARLSVPVEGPEMEDGFWITALPQQSKMFGFAQVKDFTPSRWLEEGASVSVGQEVLQVIHCPGHTPGHVVFFSASARLAVVGDVLFAGSIGRTDFPRGNHRQLIDSIRNKLWPLGRDVVFIPGHGPMSDFGEERDNNPYVGDYA